MNAIVVGAGMVGIATAWRLQDEGLGVTLLDPAPAAAASFGNAGVINPGSILPLAGPHIWRSLARYLRHADPGLRLSYTNLPRISAWLRIFLARSNEASLRETAAALAPFVAAALAEHQLLAQRAGASALLRLTGWLKLYRNPAAMHGTSLEQALMREHGIAAEVLDAASIRALEPILRPIFGAGLLYPQAWSVSDPGELCRRYHQAFLQAGGASHQERAIEINSGPRWTVRTDRGAHIAEHVVIAAGAWSADLLRPLGYRIPLAAERGYHQHFPGASLARPIYDVQRGYVMAPMQAGVRLTTGVELARRDAPPDTRPMAAILPAAREALPLGEPLPERPWLGSRPSLPDGMPAIGPSRHPGLWFAFGHGHIGFSTGPITGRLVADLMHGRAPPFDITPFSPSRFQ